MEKPCTEQLNICESTGKQLKLMGLDSICNKNIESKVQTDRVLQVFLLIWIDKNHNGTYTNQGLAPVAQ